MLTRKSKSSNNKANKTNDRTVEDGELVALRAQFDEFKRASTEERDALTSERDALAKEVCDLKEQIDDVNVVPVKHDDDSSNGSEGRDGASEQDDDMSGWQCQADVRSHLASNTQQAFATVADKFDEDGYMKCLLAQE